MRAPILSAPSASMSSRKMEIVSYSLESRGCVSALLMMLLSDYGPEAAPRSEEREPPGGLVRRAQGSSPGASLFPACSAGYFVSSSRHQNRGSRLLAHFRPPASSSR